MKKLLALALLCLATVFALTACMHEDDYYTKDQVNDSVSNLESKLNASVDSLQEKLEEKAEANKDAITLLKAEYQAKISVLEKADIDNKAALDALTATYMAKVTALELADKATADELAALKTQYASDLEALQNADKANESKIKELNDTYTAKVKELEAKDKATEGELAALKTQYASDLEALQNADKANENKIKELSDAYTAKVAELEAKDKATEGELAALKTQYESDLAALNKADADHKSAIDALNDTYTAKVAELEAKDKATEGELAALKTQYASDLAALNEADADNKSAIDALNDTYTAKVAELEAKDKATADELAALKTQYAADLAALQNADKANENKIKELNDTYTEKVEELEAKDKATEGELAALKTQYASDLEALQNADKANESKIKELNDTYTSKVKELEAKDKASPDELAALKTQYAADLVAQQNADKVNENKIKELSDAYTAKVEELEAKDKATADELAALKTQYTSDLAALKTKDAEIASSLTTCKNEMQGKIDALNTAYLAEVAEINSALSDLKGTFDSHHDRIAALENQLAEILAPDTVTVTFEPQNGESARKVTLDRLTNVEKPITPVREGYTFLGWYVSDEAWSFAGHVVAKDITLTAKWALNSYEVFLSNENMTAGTITGDGIFNYGQSVTITARANVGYTFLGWYQGGNLVSSDASYTFTLSTADVRLTAKWESLLIEPEDGDILFFTPKLDGLLDDEYLKSAYYVGARTLYGTTAAPTTEDFLYFLWDGEHFYTCAIVYDDDIVTRGEKYVNEAANENPYCNDAIELWYTFDGYIPSGSSMVNKACLDAFGKKLYSFAQEGLLSNNFDDIEYAATLHINEENPENSYYICEFKFPCMNEFGEFLDVDSIVYFSSQVNDIKYGLDDIVIDEQNLMGQGAGAEITLGYAYDYASGQLTTPENSLVGFCWTTGRNQYPDIDMGDMRGWVELMLVETKPENVDDKYADEFPTRLYELEHTHRFGEWKAPDDALEGGTVTLTRKCSFCGEFETKRVDNWAETIK